MIDGLLASDEPSIVLRTRLDVLREDPDSDAVRDAREAVRSSERVQNLAAPRLAGVTLLEVEWRPLGAG